MCEEATGDIADPAARREITGNWRMPIEAIAFHLDRLERVVVVPSRESRQHVASFRQCLAQMGLTVHVDTAADWLDPATRVDDLAFDDVTHLDDVIEGLYAVLARAGYPAREVLFDLTGGNKLATATVATAVALYADRQFQYVDTNDYGVWTYNVTYRRDE